MAQITGAQNERVFQIQKWLGLNQNPDGDTKLKMGEAATMRNWKVTRDGNLQKRPGVKEVLHLGTTAYDRIFGVWTGYLGYAGEYAVIVKGQIDSQTELPTGTAKLLSFKWDFTTEELGTFASGDVTSFDVHMFGFDDKLWILTGEEYYCFTPTIGGGTLAKVEGYVPLVATSVPPVGGTGDGTLLEQVNKLTGKRRMWISGDGVNKDFKMPDTYAITGVDYVKDLATDTNLTVTTDYTVDLPNKLVKFITAPAESQNNYEIGWHVADSDTFRGDVTKMSRSEFYNGSQDTRVFLYGDGSANAIYSDLDYSGTPRADYFPDLNQIRIGTANTPLTGLIRHYSRMMAYKPDGAWSVSFGMVTTATGDQIPGFYSTPVNKTIGHDSAARVQLVLNNPVTICGQDVYEWKASKYGNLTNDERQAHRISDRVYETLHEFDTTGGEIKTLWFADTFDDNYNQEFYLFDPETDRALVWNYAADVWYYYEDFQMFKPFSIGGQLFNASKYCGIQLISPDIHFDQKLLSEDAVAIDAYWSSGSMSFGADYQRKYAAMIWIGIKPETKGEVWVTVQTDKSVSYQEKVVSSRLFGFDDMDFEDLTFETNRKPQMHRLKIKAKKFVFYNLILQSSGPNGEDGLGCGCTVTSADMRVRFTGYAK